MRGSLSRHRRRHHPGDHDALDRRHRAEDQRLALKPPTDPLAVAAAMLAFASAAVTLFWLLGGSLGLDTVGGDIEDLARERSAPTLAALAVVFVLKGLAGALALKLTRRPLILLARIAGIGLALYGGALVLAGAIDPSGPRDEYALRWHVFCWDLWFLAWGIALAAAARRAKTAARRALNALTE